MDPKYRGHSDYTNGSAIDEHTLFPSSDQYPFADIGLKLDRPPIDPNFMKNVPFDSPDSGPNDLGLSFDLFPGGESSIPRLSPEKESFELLPGWSLAERDSNDGDSSDPVLKYISQMLMEEDMEDQPAMCYDPLALKATEKSLLDALGEHDSSSPKSYVNYENPDSNHSGTIDFFDAQSVLDVRKSNPISLQSSILNDHHFQSNSQPTSLFLENPSNGLPGIGSCVLGSSASEMAHNMFSETDPLLQFKRGLEEASKFLPKVSQLVINLESNSFANKQKEATPFLTVVEENIRRPSLPDRSRGRKSHNREDLDERSSKQSAVYVEEETEISEVFDKVLLWPGMKGAEWCSDAEDSQNGATKNLQAIEQSNGGKARAKKQSKKKETVDLRSLLILCAQAVSANDFRTANDLLKQIRQHSSPLGDGCQRVAHCFANALEARLAGSSTGIQNFFTSLTKRRMTGADILKAFRTHINACPFKRLSILFANLMIMHAAEKATTLHIVDFGVLYGFQWPILIQLLSMRDGGPPKLRITGIELPQQGFRPTEKIEETGRRLARYCVRFNVPFEYNPIAAEHWEKIPIEDLKINSNEVLAVNCWARFKSILDDTVEEDCPRDAILDLIGKMKPNIFVQCIINGYYNTPFFLTRFREALYHFSSLFDMFDSTLPHDHPERLMLENDHYGREAMNAIACEGMERVERPETYKQWQVRVTRAGFKQLPLNQGVMDTCRNKLRWYHKDFIIDEDNNWMLQGWRGRIIYGSTCWVAA